MRQWTAEERKRQAELIRNWQPWKKAGVKTPEGKARSRMNAFKHGAYGAEAKAIRRYFKECRQRLEEVNALIRIHYTPPPYRGGLGRGLPHAFKAPAPPPPDLPQRGREKSKNEERINKNYGKLLPLEGGGRVGVKRINEKIVLSPTPNPSPQGRGKDKIEERINKDPSFPEFARAHYRGIHSAAWMMAKQLGP